MIDGPKSQSVFNFLSQSVPTERKFVVKVQNPVYMKTGWPRFSPQGYWGRSPDYEVILPTVWSPFLCWLLIVLLFLSILFHTPIPHHKDTIKTPLVGGFETTQVVGPSKDLEVKVPKILEIPVFRLYKEKYDIHL